jgi:hypothetical protein
MRRSMACPHMVAALFAAAVCLVLLERAAGADTVAEAWRGT